MVQKFKSLALAGALMMVAAPAFAQDINLNPLGLDLDPFHIFTPAPAAPAMEKPMMMHHHHKMMHHKMMMNKKMMMKKKMEKK